jgi:hypothetical protein
VHQFSAFTSAIALVTVLTACSDAGVTKFNAEPTAAISSHSDGDTVRDGYAESLRGTVGDADNQLDELTVSWLIDGAEMCEETVPDSSGLVTCEHTFAVGEGEVVLEVRDPGGASGSARVTLDVQPTDAPTAQITSPDVSSTYYSDQLIAFQGEIGDGEDAAEDLTVTWESDAAGDLGLSIDITSEGAVEAYGSLAEGEHAIRLRVVDTSGKEALDSVVIQVGPPNSPPTCGITSPEDGAAGPESSEVRFEGLVGDPDVTADHISVSWTSDRDGALSDSTPDSDGTVRLAWSDLSVATHLVTLTATDEVGGSCTDSIYYTVGTPPTLTLTAPTDGDTVNEGEDVRFSATVSDNEDLPTEIGMSWSSSIDGEFSTQGADSTGEVSFRDDGLSPGDHTLTVTATDTDGLYAIRSIGLTINQPPTAPTVSISPDPAGTTTDLTATATGSVDPDSSGTVTYTFAWYEDGSLSSASTSSVFPLADTLKHHTYRVVVTPNDGTGDGPTGEAELTVQNTAPTLTGPTLSASTVSVGDVLTCTATASDVDPSDTATITYGWQDGSTGSTYTVTDSDNPGDVITCTATADDGDGGATIGTATATVQNTNPVLSAVTVTPTGPAVGDLLTCSGSATDADGDTPTLTYAWTDGSTSATYTVVASDDPGDVITCTITATDPAGGTDSGSGSVTVANTDPVLATVTISPSTANNDDTLTCTSTATDADGGTPTLTYQWDNLTTTTSLLTGATLDMTTVSVASADTVQCTATATDTDGGTASGTASLTVDNRAPTVTASLSPSSAATAADTITCTAAPADDDGDSLSTSFVWDVGGTTTSATSTSGLTSTLEGAFAYGETVTCTVTTDDGKGGTASDSASVPITNSPPVVTGVTLSPSTAQTNDTLTVSATVTDPEGDTVTTTYDWYVAGSLVLSSASATLDGATYFDKDQEVIAQVVANDGVNTTREDSAGLTIDNTPPGAPTISISPSGPTEGDSLVCLLDAASSDDDSDTVTYTMSWEVDGVLYEAGGTTDTGGLDSGDPGWLGPSTTTWPDDTVDGDDVFIGQSWTCTVTPNDGDDDGTTASTSVSTFDEVEFTTCSATGASGPSQSDCNSEYSGTDLDGDVTVTGGIQYWTAPATASYRITAVGAAGGNNTGHGYIGGYGASMSGVVSLTSGDVLAIVVGQEGTNGNDDAGGGGGSFVVLNASSTPLMIAGGGGSGGENDNNTTYMALYKNGVTSTCAQDALAHGGGLISGGCSGLGGDVDVHLYGQGGGGGFSGDGSGPGGGDAFLNGAAGSTKGGFGGGANGGGDGGGGGGGYSGGASGSGGGSPDSCGGGGGSYNAGTSQSNSSGANNADGYVTIEGA